MAALLSIFQKLGTKYKNKHIVNYYLDKEKKFDGFTKIDLEYDDAVAPIKVAKNEKSEGSLVITGKKATFTYLCHGGKWTILK